MDDGVKPGGAMDLAGQNQKPRMLVTSMDRDLVGRVMAREAISKIVRQQNKFSNVSEPDLLSQLTCDIGSALGIAATAPLSLPTSTSRRKPIARMVVNEAIARVVRRQRRLETSPSRNTLSRLDQAATARVQTSGMSGGPQPEFSAESSKLIQELPKVISIPATTFGNYWVYAGVSIPGLTPWSPKPAKQTVPFVPDLKDRERLTPDVAAPSSSAISATATVVSEALRAAPSIFATCFTYAKRAGKIAGVVLGGWLVLMACIIALFRFVNPPMSSLMIQHAVNGQKIDQRWRSLDKISPNLLRAVIVSEDWRFCQHYGIDLKEIEAAIARSRNGIPRGASTMTMQTAKNLFLWPAKSYVRKALEVPLTWMMEFFLPKWRIAEIYLNIVEWGPGVFGAEAAARHHFKKPASKLTKQEAALLAVSLPSPRTRKARAPSRRLRRMARTIRARMRQVGTGVSCIVDR